VADRVVRERLAGQQARLRVGEALDHVALVLARPADLIPAVGASAGAVVVGVQVALVRTREHHFHPGPWPAQVVRHPAADDLLLLHDHGGLWTEQRLRKPVERVRYALSIVPFLERPGIEPGPVQDADPRVGNAWPADRQAYQTLQADTGDLEFAVLVSPHRERRVVVPVLRQVPLERQGAISVRQRDAAGA